MDWNPRESILTTVAAVEAQNPAFILTEDVKVFVRKLKQIDTDFKALTDEMIWEGKGTTLNQDLIALFPQLKQIVVLYPELSMLASRYNQLVTEIPELVNKTILSGNIKEEKSYCVTCKQKLEGNCVKAAYKFYHKKCFVCNSCSKELSGTFITEHNKNYCNTCARDVHMSASTEKLPLDSEVHNIETLSS